MQPGEHDDVVAGFQAVDCGPYVGVEHQPTVRCALVSLACGLGRIGHQGFDPPDRAQHESQSATCEISYEVGDEPLRDRENGGVTSMRVSDQGPRRAILGRLPRMYRADGSPIRVLLVDDERALTNLVRMALRYEGWEIDVAHDAREAVDKYRANTPDIIVLDIMLPDMDGLGVLQLIRDSDTYTPTLFLTARDSVVDRVTGLTAGGDDYMTKPFSLEELVARLRGLLRRSAYLTPADDETLTVGDLELDGGQP